MQGNTIKLGEETDFFNRLYSNSEKYQLYNLTDMSITHFEAAYKIETSYLKKRIILSGQYFSFKNKKKIKGLTKIYLKIIKQSIDFLINIIKMRRFRYLKNRWIIQGIINGLYEK